LPPQRRDPRIGFCFCSSCLSFPQPRPPADAFCPLGWVRPRYRSPRTPEG
jgi:hypothetical protein